MYILAAAFLIIAGLVMLIKPEAVFYISESWKHSGSGEPSLLYIISTRIGVGICFLLGIVAIMAEIFL